MRSGCGCARILFKKTQSECPSSGISLEGAIQYQGFNPGNPDQIRADRGRGVMLDRRSIASIAVATLVAAIGLGAQAQNSSKFPDWSGQWDRVPDGGVPRYDPTKPIRKQQAPLRPEY